MFTDIHSLAPNLVVIEGRHPTLLWETCDVPSIVVYRAPKPCMSSILVLGPSNELRLKHRWPLSGKAPKRLF
jgi:hypothetical protein